VIGPEIMQKPPSPGPEFAEISLRRLPYPYNAMLAICSDLDKTPDVETYRSTMRYFNTTENTPVGPGVGLEIGNSIYFDMPPGQFAYWNTPETGRDMIRTFIKSGHVDCLHSFGELATTRAHAARALEELTYYGCRIPVWTDHSRSPTNFGRDVTYGGGDRVGHKAYHADLTVAHGVRFVWRGRVTSIIGQDTSPRFEGILVKPHPIRSAKTVGKEMAKHFLARCGSSKYEIHLPNRVLRRSSLRDNQPIYEFIRCNPHWGGVSSCETAEGIGRVLTDGMLRRLILRRGICILYTHLGKTRESGYLFDVPAREAFLRLKAYRDSGEILTATTYRLLRYVAVRDSLLYTSTPLGPRVTITIDGVDDPVIGWHRPSLDELQGITFVCRGFEEVDLRDDWRRPLACRIFQRGEVTYAAIPWRPLEFPDI